VKLSTQTLAMRSARHPWRTIAAWMVLVVAGTAVAITGIVLLGIGGLFGADWERREIDKYLRRRG
jgi:type IV secretory pathway VirB2 component (pilin)